MMTTSIILHDMIIKDECQWTTPLVVILSCRDVHGTMIPIVMGFGFWPQG
jgi:hypothetical protein